MRVSVERVDMTGRVDGYAVHASNRRRLIAQYACVRWTRGLDG